MRAKLVVIAGFIAFAAPICAAEDLPNRFEVGSMVQRDASGAYKLEWQKRLLTIQHAFAAELIDRAGIDYTATGSITQTDRAPLQH
ncbi:MAG: hypothetical protein IR164_16870 [Devosia sp.]|uniref:hypothetical protein n=1 Tax=Devosia sp. TaxID=1871048 RepID=UPI0019E43585|nr:hypothetical protein [Devosia sp.]MBF0680600.1 hypothetical protein [Devosia sp.]